MLKYGVGLIVRAMVELSLALLVFAGLLAVVAYRTARLFVTPEPDKLDRLAGGLATTLRLAARASSATDSAGEVGSPPAGGETELDEPANVCSRCGFAADGELCEGAQLVTRSEFDLAAREFWREQAL
jgi:hypothetical protein